MRRSGIILLVEDTQDDIALTIRAFERSKIVCQVVVVRDGEEALDYVLGRGAYSKRDPTIGPDVVLLDLGLPKVGGLSVLRQLRASEATRHLPIVILSSSDDQTDIIKGYDVGASSFIRKPVNMTEFVDAARHLGLDWLVPPKTPVG